MVVFERFDNINHMPLRVFNRVAFLHNLISDSGKSAGESYIALFKDFERKQMFLMSAYMKKVGVDQVRKEVTKGLEIIDDEVQA